MQFHYLQPVCPDNHNNQFFQQMIHIKALGLEVRHMLGSGSFAQVFECYDHRQNKEYAVKVPRLPFR